MNRVVNTEALQEVWYRWKVGDPIDLAERATAIRAYREGPPAATAGPGPRPPYRWLLQPVDVVVFGVCHFLLGVWLGWLVDSRLFGPLTSAEREAIIRGESRWPTWWRVLVQLTLVLLLFNYMRKTLLLIQPRYGSLTYRHEPVPHMDGGFAMSLGFAWTQRNLVQRLGVLLTA